MFLAGLWSEVEADRCRDLGHPFLVPLVCYRLICELKSLACVRRLLE